MPFNPIAREHARSGLKGSVRLQNRFEIGSSIMTIHQRSCMDPAALFAQIELVAPTFGAVAKQHIEDNGELLPHLLMADLLRYVGASIGGAEDAVASESEVRAVLALLEAGAVCGNTETENAVALSFCEGMESEPFFPKLRPLLGLALRRLIKNPQAVTHAR
jgi:hypothetical protein